MASVTVTMIAGDIPDLLSWSSFDSPPVLLLILVDKYGEFYEEK
jgi:hypothetical protein